MQEKLRKEVTDTWTEVLARGDAGPTSSDFDKMKYTTAVIKVIDSFLMSST